MAPEEVVEEEAKEEAADEAEAETKPMVRIPCKTQEERGGAAVEDNTKTKAREWDQQSPKQMQIRPPVR